MKTKASGFLSLSEFPLLEDSHEAFIDGALPGEVHPEPFYLGLQGGDLLVLQLRAPLELAFELFVGEAAVVVVVNGGVELALDIVRDSPVVVVDPGSLASLLQQAGGLPVAVVVQQLGQLLQGELRLSALDGRDEGYRHLKVLRDFFLTQLVGHAEGPEVHGPDTFFVFFHKTITFAVNLKIK